MTDTATPMHCPKCRAAMHALEGFEEAVVHRCEGCRGMWFEIMAHEQLRADAARIDLGEPASPAEGEYFDPTAPAPATLLCPACDHYPLVHMVDPHQPHIRFESCKFCYGRFYDAGEFKDFADDSEYDTAFDRLLKKVSAALAD
jgi:Zn-finger nucleic acid-binding protein